MSCLDFKRGASLWVTLPYYDNATGSARRDDS